MSAASSSSSRSSSSSSKSSASSSSSPSTSSSSSSTSSSIVVEFDQLEIVDVFVDDLVFAGNDRLTGFVVTSTDAAGRVTGSGSHGRGGGRNCAGCDRGRSKLPARGSSAGRWKASRNDRGVVTGVLDGSATRLARGTRYRWTQRRRCLRDRPADDFLERHVRDAHRQRRVPRSISTIGDADLARRARAGPLSSWHVRAMPPFVPVHAVSTMRKYAHRRSRRSVAIMRGTLISRNTIVASNASSNGNHPAAKPKSAWSAAAACTPRNPVCAGGTMSETASRSAMPSAMIPAIS